MRAVIIAMLLATAACSGTSGENKPPSPVALVELVRVEQGPARETVTIYGTADNGASANAVLSAPAEAIIIAIDAPVGTPVRAGQLVVRLRPSPTVRLDIVRASADAQAAQLALARAQRLRVDGLVSNAEVESAHAAARTSRATLSSLNSRRGSLDLRAPVSGFVQSVANSPGDLVAAGATVATIAKTGDLRGRFGVDPALARRIPGGTSVRVTPSSGGVPVGLPVLSVDPSVDPQTRLASLYVRIPQATGMGAGEPLTGDLLVSGAGNAVTVPYAALLDDGGQAFVYVVAKGMAHRRDIKVAPTGGERVRVLGGLRPGELVVIGGATALEDGLKVRTR